MQYQVMVVEDSAFMRAELTKIIEKDKELQVVATARNGQMALEMIKKHSLDVITMDINMPVLNGIETLKKIMLESPLPVIMISSLTQEGAEETMDALHLGAFDFIPKPSGAISLNMATQGEMIREKVKTAARNSKKMKARRGASFLSRSSIEKKKTVIPLQKSKPSNLVIKATPIGKFVGIGVSTGGPNTLMKILPGLPGNFDGCLLIAQHMPEKFTLSFANRLNKICAMTVKEAEDGEIIKKGTIYIAPGGKQMRVINRNHRIFLIDIIDDVPDKLYKPSVDILFESLLESLNNNWLGVMLTGMGGDGSVPLTKLKQLGGHTIVESEESCVVFGMPGKVVSLGGAEFILNKNEIVKKIIELT